MFHKGKMNPPRGSLIFFAYIWIFTCGNPLLLLSFSVTEKANCNLLKSTSAMVWMFVSIQYSYAEILKPLIVVVVVGGGGVVGGDLVRRVGPLEWDWCHCMGDPTEISCSFYHVRLQPEGTDYGPENGLSPNTEPDGALIWNLLDFRTVWNIFLLFINHLNYSILL